MDDDLIQRLLFAETDFLTALSGGTQALASYSQTLSVLPDILRAASKSGDVGKETLYLAHSVASRIANLASCFLDIRRMEESYTTFLQKDCDAMLHQMAALDLNASPKSLQVDDRNKIRRSRSSSNARIANVESSHPPFLASAHQWLLDNLYNPYPTAEVKTRIAAVSSCQVSSVSSWFINARRRIGWTTLCREHFSNCRADMIDAAYRALVEEDPQRALSPKLRHSFVAMKVAAEGLYPSTLTRSAIVEDLDAKIKDSTQVDKEFTGGKCGQADKAGFTVAVQSSYPSPDSSTTASPVPDLGDSLADESEKEEDVATPIFAGSKRRRSSIEPVDEPSSTTSRLIKRPRASLASWTCFPSPPSSTDGTDEPTDKTSPEPPSVHSTLFETSTVLPSCKRRVSDADVTGIPKRPRDSIATPRLHAVSNPLSRSNMESEYSIDEWFNTNFDALFAIPPPVDAVRPDLSTPWEVELFKDYSIPGNSKYAPRCPPAPTADTHMPAPPNLSDLDSLLRSIDGDAFAASSDTVLPSNITRTVYEIPLDPSLPDISRVDIDWTALLNNTEAFQPSVFPQCSTEPEPLPEIDLSMLQLPQVVPAVNPQSDLALKRAKLHQLHTMQEAVWRMEQELRSEGVVI